MWKFIFFMYFLKEKMYKMDVMVFASICFISAFYIYVFDRKNKFKKKINKEVDEVIRKLNHGDDTSKKKCVDKK